VQLFRYSAVTWNAHRIHFEREYAQREGHPDILVQAHLHGAFLLQMIGDWMGPRARLVTFGWSNRGRAVPGDTLTCTGRVVGKRDDGGRHVVDLEVVETNQRGEVCAPGKATVALPSRETAR
jgi:hydroxyacyl-ACP dehydratase HTD2-like protein with hotdog domain